MQPDLNHIQRQIQSHQVNIDEARRQANVQRQLSDQKRNDGDDNGASYYDLEAERFEQKANDLQDELDQLKADEERTQKRIDDLEGQKAQLTNEHTDRIKQITDELNRLRGSSLTL